MPNKLADHDQWLRDHPTQAWIVAVGVAALILEVALFIKIALETFVAWMQR